MIPSDLQPVALTLRDGRLSIMYLVTAEYSQETGQRTASRPATDTVVREELAKWADGGKEVVSWRFIRAEDVPLDRTYRAAWRDNGKEIHHDMAHARQLHLEMVRNARTEQLGRLDRDWMRAMGRGNARAAEAVEAQRQALRDLPTTLPVDKAATVEQLKALWPEGLLRA